MNIQLNQSLDIKSLKREFQKSQKLRIESVLLENSAEYILDNLSEITWHLVHSDEKGLPVRYTPETLEMLTSDEETQMYSKLHSRASNNYSYIYKYYPIIDDIKSGALPVSSMLYQVAAFVNGTEFLNFARELTGVNTLVKMDPQATLYEGGHFLTTHDDSNYQRAADDTSSRRFAVVFGFTKEWSSDWGGQTSFFDSVDSKASSSWYPGFNTMTIFQVPILHSVNYVTPFANEGRYSITGWLRDDPKINRQDLSSY